MPVLWPFVPLPEIVEALVFQTDIRETPQGEIRDGLHAGVRTLSLAHSCGNDLPRAEALFRANALGEWYLPVWQEASKAGAVADSDTVITVNEYATWGAKALIFSGVDDYVLADVASVGSGTITLTAPVGQAFVNPTVAPVVTAIAPLGLSIGKRNARHHSFEATFRVLGAEDIAATDLPQYDGLDYVACAGVAIQPLQATLLQPAEVFEDGFGAVAVEELREVLEGRWGMTMVRTSAEGRYALKRWLYSLRGRDRPFWAPAWKGARTLAAAATTGQTSVLIEPVVADPASYVGQHLFLGGTQFREVTAAVTDSLNHRLSVAALSADATEVRIIRKVRLDADRIEIRHRRGFAAQITTTLAEIAA